MRGVLEKAAKQSSHSEQAGNGHHTGGYIAEDPRKCSFECGVVCVSGFQESCKQQRPEQSAIFNGQGHGVELPHLNFLYKSNNGMHLLCLYETNL